MKHIIHDMTRPFTFLAQSEVSRFVFVLTQHRHSPYIPTYLPTRLPHPSSHIVRLNYRIPIHPHPSNSTTQESPNHPSRTYPPHLISIHHKKRGGERGSIHLRDKPILINRSPLLAVRLPRRLRPHLLDVLQHHVAVTIKRLDPREELPVVAAGDEDLVVRADGGLED